MYIAVCFRNFTNGIEFERRTVLKYICGFLKPSIAALSL